ncbi:MAG: flagellar M-ring protein FliF [Rhodobacteraceae bacterium]|nr:flagellar M-ring protein FliF [Paracoccaceae bacterium]
MPQILTLWSNLDPRRRLVVVLATIAIFAAVLGLTRMATTPGMALLYAGLESDAAGEVIAALDQEGVAYEVRGTAIYVDQARRDSVRMTLAADGLPANTGAGYELLDKLSGFGTTSQMFDAAYWRAREGELARTIIASPMIRAARVHIAARDSQPFRTLAAPTASVSLTPASGRVSPEQAQAVQHLVAAAVAGMRPEDVSVIDANSGLVQSPDSKIPAAMAAQDRASALRQSVQRLLEARVGPGNAVVEVTVDTDNDLESITERRIDPNGRVAISTDTEERTQSAKDTGKGAVTVASNLPEGDAKGGGTEESRENTTRNRVNYELSETRREISRAPGTIKRISVAVLLGGIRAKADDGTETWTPRPEAEVTALHDLVSSAIGFDAERGDVITIRSLELQPDAVQGTLAQSSWLAAIDLMSLAQIVVLSVVALVLGLFVLRPILASGNRARPAAPIPIGGPSATPLGRAALTGDGAASRDAALTGEIDEGGFTPALPALGNRGAQNQAAQDQPAPDPVARLRQLIEDRREETVEILRGWMEDRDEQEENA